MDDKQKQFLLFRSSGKSFDYIVKELKISKPTAIKWSKLLENELNDIRFSALTALKEQYVYNTVAKYEALLKHLNKVDKAIEVFDMTQSSLKELMLLRNDLLAQLERLETCNTYLNTGIISTNLFGEKEVVTMSLKELE